MKSPLPLVGVVCVVPNWFGLHQARRLFPVILIFSCLMASAFKVLNAVRSSRFIRG